MAFVLDVVVTIKLFVVGVAVVVDSVVVVVSEQDGFDG